MTRLGTQRTMPACRRCTGRERGVLHTCGRRNRRHPPEVPVPGCRACEGARVAHTCTFLERAIAVSAHVEAQGAASTGNLSGQSNVYMRALQALKDLT